MAGWAAGAGYAAAGFAGAGFAASVLLAAGFAGVRCCWTLTVLSHSHPRCSVALCVVAVAGFVAAGFAAVKCG